MTEQDVREGLHGAVADEPPLDLDPDALVATARRGLRRRRALVSVSVATAGVAVAAVALPVLLGIPGDQHGGGIAPADRPAATATGTADRHAAGTDPADRPTPGTADGPAPGTGTAGKPTSIPWPPAGVQASDYTADKLRHRGEQMRAHLRKALTTTLPHATDVTVGQFGGEADGAVADGQSYLNSFATFTLDRTRFGIAVNVFAPGAHPDGPEELCAPDPGRCRQLDSPDLLAVDVDAGQANPAIRILSVYHFRKDGSVVSVAGYNYDPTAGALPADPEPMPVTTGQLAALAVNPALGL